MDLFFKNTVKNFFAHLMHFSAPIRILPLKIGLKITIPLLFQDRKSLKYATRATPKILALKRKTRNIDEKYSNRVLAVAKFK